MMRGADARVAAWPAMSSDWWLVSRKYQAEGSMGSKDHSCWRLKVLVSMPKNIRSELLRRSISVCFLTLSNGKFIHVTGLTIM